MTTAKPLVKQVDHIIIRVDDSSSDQLFSLLSDTLQLPVAWPLAPYPAFKSGGIFAGNVNLELLTVGSQPVRSSRPTTGAHLYGLAFEPLLKSTVLGTICNYPQSTTQAKHGFSDIGGMKLYSIAPTIHVDLSCIKQVVPGNHRRQP